MRRHAELVPVVEPAVPSPEREEVPELAAETASAVHDQLGNGWLRAALSGGGGALGEYVRMGLAMATEGIDPGLFSSNQAMLAVMRAAERPDRAPAPPSGAGQALPAAVQERMTAALGHDFAHVRVHTGAAAEEYADVLGAHAVTIGTDIWFGAGEYQPGTDAGDALLRHELTHVVQHDEGRVHGVGVSSPGDPLEREAYAAEGAVGPAAGGAEERAGSPAGVETGMPSSSTSPALRSAVEVPAERYDLATILGWTFAELRAWTRRQADWFTGLDAAGRDRIWPWILASQAAKDIDTAIGTLPVSQLLPLDDVARGRVCRFAQAFTPDYAGPRLRRGARDLAEALRVGAALEILEAAIPREALGAVIPTDGLYALLDTGRTGELVTYHRTFSPTLEHPGEWPALLGFLLEGVSGSAPLAEWIHDAHLLTPAARMVLITNLEDTRRVRPLTLVLVGATDHNGAMLLDGATESVIFDPSTLALVLQGPTSIAEAQSQVESLADVYGQAAQTFDVDEATCRDAPGLIHQVIFSAHGSPRTVGLAADGAPTLDPDGRATYDQERLTVGTADTDALLDAIFDRSDPAGLHVVFYACSVAGRVLEGPPLGSSPEEAREAMEEQLRTDPNLAEYVRGRMAEQGILGDVQAARTEVQTGQLETAPGASIMVRPEDPASLGSAQDYLERGREPQAVLAALAERLGDRTADTTALAETVRTRRARLAGSNAWTAILLDVALECAAPPDLPLHAGRIMDVASRVQGWATPTETDPESFASAIREEELDRVVAAVSRAFPSAPGLALRLAQVEVATRPASLTRLADALDAEPSVLAIHERVCIPVVLPHLPALLDAGRPGALRLALALVGWAGDRVELAHAFLTEAGLFQDPVPPEIESAWATAGLGDVLSLREWLQPAAPPPSPANAPLADGGTNVLEVNGSPQTLLIEHGTIHDAPRSDAKALARLDNPTELRASGRVDGFWLVDFDGRRGFVAEDEAHAR